MPLQALTIYKELLAFDDPDPMYYVYAGACYYYIGLYKEAETTTLQVGYYSHTSCIATAQQTRYALQVRLTSEAPSVRVCVRDGVCVCVCVCVCVYRVPGVRCKCVCCSTAHTSWVTRAS